MSGRALGVVLAVGMAVSGCGAAVSSGRERWVEPLTGMTFVQIPAGRFVMGSPAREHGREDQELEHDVQITEPFWMGTFEVTQDEWRTVMSTTPSRFQESGKHPVEQVTWFEVQEFFRSLNARGSGGLFRLPTEAEWEYACRAGTTTPFSTGAALGHEQANFAQSPEAAAGGSGSTAVSGSFAPNPWGLHDMHGNVWEWTEDAHCPYEAAPARDPRSSCEAPLKVIRGGSWYFGADSARCALRYTHRPQDRGFSLGFRVVREAPVP